MPKKYTPQLDDYMMFAAVSSMYQMFRPIEEKLRAAGYTGVLFSDYDSMINNQGNENWPDTDFRARRLYAEQNGLSDTPDFANWYKSFTDTLATSIGNAPIGIMLTGYAEKFIRLYNHNPSFNRIFHIHELSSLTDDEIKEFYTDIFSIYKMDIEPYALDFMTKYSSGMPTMMQEIGDATFWSDEDNFIDKNDAIKGIIEAGNRIGLKYLQPLLDQKIRSENYLSLFKKIGKKLAAAPNSTFTKKEFSNVLNDQESKVFKDFISRARKLGIIELASSKKQGEYQFTNQLYPMYFMIQTFKEENMGK